MGAAQVLSGTCAAAVFTLHPACLLPTSALPDRHSFRNDPCMSPSIRSAARVTAALAAGLFLTLHAAASDGIGIQQHPNRISVSVDGELFTELVFAGAPKPYLYPLFAPGGIAVTRHFPMRTNATDEAQDHPHHRSLWFTHGEVNGVDFWAEGPTKGRVLQQEILETKSGRQQGVIRTANLWMTHDGKPILTDETRITFRKHPGGRMLDYAITLHASQGTDLTFGDTKEGTMALRLAESMRLQPNKYYAGKTPGTILQDTGVKDGNTWGKRAAWTAYTGPVQNSPLTVTVFDHPSNPRYPTWWHVRDYGLFAANPFGVHDFEKKPAGTGNLVVKAGVRITFQYRILIQTGAADPAALATVAADFAKHGLRVRSRP